MGLGLALAAVCCAAVAFVLVEGPTPVPPRRAEVAFVLILAAIVLGTLGLLVALD